MICQFSHSVVCLWILLCCVDPSFKFWSRLLYFLHDLSLQVSCLWTKGLPEVFCWKPDSVLSLCCIWGEFLPSIWMKMTIQPVNCNLWKRPFSSLAYLCNPDECQLDIRVNVCSVCPVPARPSSFLWYGSKFSSLTHCFQSYFSYRCQSLNVNFVVLGIPSRACTYSASAPPLIPPYNPAHSSVLFVCRGYIHAMTCMWSSEENLRCWSSSSVLRVLFLFSTFTPKQLGLEPAGIFLSPLLILLHVWITDTIDHMWLLHRFWRSRLQFSHSHGKGIPIEPSSQPLSLRIRTSLSLSTESHFGFLIGIILHLWMNAGSNSNY